MIYIGKDGTVEISYFMSADNVLLVKIRTEIL